MRPVKAGWQGEHARNTRVETGWVAPGRSLRYKRLENRMPDHTVISDFCVCDFSIKAWLNPCRAPLLERLRQRRCGPRKGLQSATDFRGSLTVPSRSHAPDIDQRATFTAGKAQLTQANRTFGREADHGEALTFPTFDLEPLFTPTRVVRSVSALRYN